MKKQTHNFGLKRFKQTYLHPKQVKLARKAG